MFVKKGEPSSSHRGGGGALAGGKKKEGKKINQRRMKGDILSNSEENPSNPCGKRREIWVAKKRAKPGF